MHTVPEGWAITIDVTYDKAYFKAYRINDTDLGIKFDIEIMHKESTFRSRFSTGKDFSGPIIDFTFIDKAINFTPIEIISLVVYKYILIFKKYKSPEIENMLKGLMLELSVRPEVVRLAEGTDDNSIDIEFDEIPEGYIDGE